MEKDATQIPTSPLLVFDLECPICFNVKIKNYALKAKTLPSRPNVFEVPVYEESPKFSHVDFNELTQTVCYHCFYTGSKKSDFNYVDPHSQIRSYSEANKKIIEHWQKNPKEIENVLMDCFINASSFTHPRTSEGVIASYKLAIYKAGLEILYKIPYGNFKRAKLYIKLYYLHNMYYKNFNKEYLIKAAEDLEEVFRTSDFPEKSYEFEVCYLLVAINTRLGEDGKAGSYIKALDQSKGELAGKAKDNPNINLQDINKWLSKAKNLWQSRTDPEVWKLEKPLNLF